MVQVVWSGSGLVQVWFRFVWFRFVGMVQAWFRFGPGLVPVFGLVQVRFRFGSGVWSGSGLVQVWFRFGSGLVQVCFRFGRFRRVGLVQVRFRFCDGWVGVSVWFRFGSGLVQLSWSGSGLVWVWFRFSVWYRFVWFRFVVWVLRSGSGLVHVWFRFWGGSGLVQVCGSGFQGGPGGANLECDSRAPHPLLQEAQQELQNLAEDAPLKHHLPQALGLIRLEIGQLVRYIEDEDIGEGSWTMVRAPWTPPSSVDDEAPAVEVSTDALQFLGTSSTPPWG